MPRLLTRLADVRRASTELEKAFELGVTDFVVKGSSTDVLGAKLKAMLDQLVKDQAPDQVANVAFLPGIQHASLAMPDIHWGYGFCIGGVAATFAGTGVGVAAVWAMAN